MNLKQNDIEFEKRSNNNKSIKGSEKNHNAILMHLFDLKTSTAPTVFYGCCKSR